MAPVDRVTSAINVAASLLSLLGTSFILVCYLLLPRQQHIRHALIVNLTVADFINALNNSTSGLWVLINNRNLTDGDECVLNGFVGQLSVQAVDCSILAITIVTLWIVRTEKLVTSSYSLRTLVLICASSWVLPLITSFIALANGWYHPAAPNWCWIQSEPVYLRYVLTHGWRFLIISIATGICVYIQIFLHRHARKVASIKYRGESQSIGQGQSHGSRPDDVEKMLPSPLQEKSRMTHGVQPAKQSTAGSPSLEKAMLLNAYPILYIILWLPGIANRIADATGHTVYALELLQASTQLIGFANALTFGWNERIANQLKDLWKERTGHRTWRRIG